MCGQSGKCFFYSLAVCIVCFFNSNSQQVTGKFREFLALAFFNSLGVPLSKFISSPLTWTDLSSHARFKPLVWHKLLVFTSSSVVFINPILFKFIYFRLLLLVPPFTWCVFPHCLLLLTRFALKVPHPLDLPILSLLFLINGLPSWFPAGQQPLPHVDLQLHCTSLYQH